MSALWLGQIDPQSAADYGVSCRCLMAWPERGQEDNLSHGVRRAAAKQGDEAHSQAGQIQ